MTWAPASDKDGGGRAAPAAWSAKLGPDHASQARRKSGCGRWRRPPHRGPSRQAVGVGAGGGGRSPRPSTRPRHKKIVCDRRRIQDATRTRADGPRGNCNTASHKHGKQQEKGDGGAVALRRDDAWASQLRSHEPASHGGFAEAGSNRRRRRLKTAATGTGPESSPEEGQTRSKNRRQIQSQRLTRQTHKRTCRLC
jgi:hypothetical protein